MDESHKNKLYEANIEDNQQTSQISLHRDNSHELSRQTNKTIHSIKLSRGERWATYSVFLWIAFITAFDGGIIPAAKEGVMNDLKTDTEGFGLLGSVDFIGRIVGSLLYTTIINKINRKYFLIFSLILKAGILFGELPHNIYILHVVLRCISGFSQVYTIIFLNIWCDQYGPRNGRTMMITFIQLGLPLGIVGGYGIVMLTKSWKLSLLIQAICIVILSIITIFLPNIFFSNTLVLLQGSDIEGDENPHETRVELIRKSKTNMLSSEKKDQNKQTIWSKLSVIMCEMVFLFTSFSYSIICFAMSIIQFWSPDYMETELDPTDESIRFLIYAAICISAPILGTVTGGILGSLVGGYTHKKAMMLCFGLNILSSAFGLVIGFTKTLIIFAIFVWFYSFFACAIIPIENGIIISSLPHHLRGDGFSVMNFILNLTGNMPSTYAFGLLAQLLNKKIAMQIIMYYSTVSLVALFIGMIFRLKKHEDIEQEYSFKEDSQIAEEYSK